MGLHFTVLKKIFFFLMTTSYVNIRVYWQCQQPSLHHFFPSEMQFAHQSLTQKWFVQQFLRKSLRLQTFLHPFIIPRRLLRRASRYKEVFLLQCVLRSVDRKKLNQTASYHLNQLKQDNAFSKVQTGLCTEHNSIFKICLCLVEKKKKTIAEPKW
jgi:hypothetical protein